MPFTQNVEKDPTVRCECGDLFRMSSQPDAHADHEVQATEDAWSMRCSCGFSSTDWPQRKLAELRARQHNHEHTHGELMPTVDEVLVEAGLRTPAEAE